MGSFAVDGVKAENEADEGPEHSDKLHKGKESALGAEEHEKDELGLGHSFQVFLETDACHVTDDETHHGDEGKEDHESETAEIVREFFSINRTEPAHESNLLEILHVDFLESELLLTQPELLPGQSVDGSFGHHPALDHDPYPVGDLLDLLQVV
jgi:hypothetical protein